MPFWTRGKHRTCVEQFVTRDPETNSKLAPENGWLEYFLVSFWGPAYFQGRLLLVSGSVPKLRFFATEWRDWLPDKAEMLHELTMKGKENMGIPYM